MNSRPPEEPPFLLLASKEVRNARWIISSDAITGIDNPVLNAGDLRTDGDDLGHSVIPNGLPLMTEGVLDAWFPSLVATVSSSGSLMVSPAAETAELVV